MLFSSIPFLFYFLPTLLILYYVLRFSKALQNFILLCFSLLFYAWGSVEHLAILLLSVALNYAFALLVHRYKDRKSLSRSLLWTACILNVSMLFFFTYLIFFAEALNDIFRMSIPLEMLEFSVPVGISFFTLKAISYLVDVYNQKNPVEKNPLYVGLYISFFPQILAGPIIQYSAIAQQFKDRKETLRTFSVGFCRFATGLAKKVLIADSLAVIVDHAYLMNNISGIPATLAWLGAIAFTLQIYYNFSGYSDMAIGLCLMFGFVIDENFNHPYMSQSITEFWRRWHISLTKWFREYIYIPLGGSRLENTDKIIRNIFVVWLLVGIWHGPNWTFLLWALLNFAFVAIERMLLVHKMTSRNILRRLYTLFVINLLWVIFRADGLLEAGYYIASLFGVHGFYSPFTMMFLRENIVFLLLAIVGSISVSKKMNHLIVLKAPLAQIFNMAYPVYIFFIFIISILYLAKGIHNPFL